MLLAITMFSCKKDETTTPTTIDRSGFIGKWVGGVIVTINNAPQTLGIDTIILANHPTNANQIIDTKSLGQPVYTLTDSKNYTLPNISDTAIIDGIKWLVTQSNAKGVLTNTTTITENGNISFQAIGASLLITGSYNITYIKQ